MKLNCHTPNTLDDHFETIAWALLLMLWGLTILFDFLPGSLGILGTGLILLGLNVVRSRYGVPTRGGTTIIGLLALLWGGLELASQRLPLPFVLSDWAIVAILLIVLGGILLAREVQGIRKTDVESLP